jgi:hypothetical protein
VGEGAIDVVAADVIDLRVFILVLTVPPIEEDIAEDIES